MKHTEEGRKLIRLLKYGQDWEYSYDFHTLIPTLYNRTSGIKMHIEGFFIERVKVTHFGIDFTEIFGSQDRKEIKKLFIDKVESIENKKLECKSKSIKKALDDSVSRLPC